MKKRIIQISFIILTLFVLWYLNGVLCVKSENGINQARALYYQPRNTIDVVMLGSSHIHCDIDTGILWDKYGIASYDYSAAAQPIWCTYYYLKEFCKYQDPKVAVLDLYSIARYADEDQYAWMNENLFGMRFSVNKLRMINDSIDIHNIEEYFPAFFTYHGRYRDLTIDDLTDPFTKGKKLAVFKGYTPCLGREKQIEPTLDEKTSVGVAVKSEIYLTKIIEYTRDNNIELFLIVTPYITNDYDETVYNRIREIADSYGLHFNSTNYDYSRIGLDFERDFHDSSHLNYWGAYKFTEYLGEELKERFDLPDRREEKGYESWQANFEEIAKHVEDNAEEE